MPRKKHLAKLIAANKDNGTGEKMNTNDLSMLTKDSIPTLSKNLCAAEINFLFQTLNEKEDTIRYNAFLLLQSKSRESPLVYEYWSELEKKLESPNSYQRSIGIMLLAENVRWDKNDKFSKTFNKYMNCCNDEKFITARQAIQGLSQIVGATGKYDERVKEALVDLQVAKYKENQQKLLKKDVAAILKILENKSALS